MGKKGTWISAIKSLFTSNNKFNEGKEKKGLLRGKLKHGSSFIPRFREPSSIEKILGEVDQQQLHHLNLNINTNIPQTQPQPSSPPTITSPPTTLVHHHPPIQETTQPQHHLSATRIQAAYRGYLARKKTKPSTTSGLMRLQGVVRGQQVKRQTVNAMKQMQLLVRLQTQIHSRRIHMLPLKHQPNNNNNKQQQALNDDEYYWDDSLITKEEREARLHRKAEAVINRERAMTYAYSHQLWKATPPKNSLMGIRSPWWWSRLERHFPCEVDDDVKNPPQSKATPIMTKKQTKNSSSASASPMSSRSMVPPRTRMNPYPYPIKDDDSLMSCPAFSVPNYMTPTLSAKAKARPSSNPRDRMPTTPGSTTTEKRLSFPPTPNSCNASSSSSFYWKKGSTSRKHKSPASVGELSTADSAISSVLGRRKAFNRFV